MARILVAGDRDGVAAMGLLSRLVERLRADGHDGILHEGPARRAVREADALIAVLDRLDPATASLIAYCDAAQKPVLGLAHPATDVDPALEAVCTLARGPDEAAWMEALPRFYDAVRPFAGRLVRDHIPRLVKEAGYEVQFRQLDDDELPRFLRQKIVTEAEELARAGSDKEREEIGDILEALERFIEVRGHGRDDLRRVKEAKRKRRGGFEKGYVVEETADSGAP